MSRDLATTAARYAARAPGQVVLYSQGGEMILAVGRVRTVETIGGTEQRVETTIIGSRRVTSAGQARRVHAQYEEVLAMWPHLGFVRALEHAIELVQAELRVATRRARGRCAP